MATQAQRAAVARYDQKLDRINCRLPKGTADRIRKTGDSLNGFIVSAVLEKLDRIEQETKQ